MKLISYFLPILLIGCSSVSKHDYTFIEIPNEINKDPKKTLSKEDTEYDIEQTLYALNTAYSGRKFLPKNEFKNLTQSIGSITGSSSAYELCQQIDNFMDKVSDNHLNAKFGNKPCFASPLSRDGKVGSNFYRETKDIPWKVQLAKKNKKMALLISITGFPKSTSPVWKGFIDKVKHLLPQSQFVIIDMRGNGGGDDNKGAELANLLAGANLKRPYNRQWNGFTPESFQVFINTFEYWARLNKDDGKEVPPYILALKKEFIEKRDKAIKGEPPQTQTDDGKLGEGFVYAKSIQKPIYILIDADCASSCESTTDYFELNQLVKTVGENTAGYIHFGNNGSVFLKNSGIQLQMAISYNSYIDGRFIEKKGITPKIAVPSGKNAMDYAWADFIKQKH